MGSKGGPEASLASVAEVEVDVDFNSGSYLLKYAEYIRGRYIVQPKYSMADVKEEASYMLVKSNTEIVLHLKLPDGSPRSLSFKRKDSCADLTQADGWTDCDAARVVKVTTLEQIKMQAVFDALKGRVFPLTDRQVDARLERAYTAKPQVVVKARPSDYWPGHNQATDEDDEFIIRTEVRCCEGGERQVIPVLTLEGPMSGACPPRRRAQQLVLELAGKGLIPDLTIRL